MPFDQKPDYKHRQCTQNISGLDMPLKPNILPKARRRTEVKYWTISKTPLSMWRCSIDFIFLGTKVISVIMKMKKQGRQKIASKRVDMSLLFAIAMYVAVHLDNLISIRFWAACIGRLGVALHPSVRSDVLVEDEVVEHAAPRMMTGNVIVEFGRYFLHLQEREKERDISFLDCLQSLQTTLITRRFPLVL